MNRLDLRETIAHHAIAPVGGFFGIYALLLRNATFGSSETSNLIYLFATGLSGDFHEFWIRIGAMFVYIGGIAFAVIIPKYIKKVDFRYIAAIVDAVCCVVLASIPEDAHFVIALYPMFFAMAVQWLAFTSASGFNSATVFSTNNIRQCVVGIIEYIYNRDRKYLLQFQFFAGVLICFHLGVLYAYFCMRYWGYKSIYACLPLIGISFICTFLTTKRPR